MHSMGTPHHHRILVLARLGRHHIDYGIQFLVYELIGLFKAITLCRIHHIG